MSVASDGTQGNDNSLNPTLSADGNTIAYHSYASNLVSGDTSGYSDVFAYDVATGTTSRISIAKNGEQGDDDSALPAISADGGVVAYRSNASNLFPGDSNSSFDIFLARLNRSPQAVDLSTTVAENTPVGSVIGTVSATDTDGDVLSFSITAGNGSGLFSIDNNGVITLTGVLDYETAAQHVLTVTVSDGYLSDTATVTVNVTDVTPFTDTSGSVFENDIEWLATTGITRGCNPPVNDQFCPTGHVTRGQMAAFLHRALG